MGGISMGEKENPGSENYKQFQNENDEEGKETSIKKLEDGKFLEPKCPNADGFKIIVIGCVLFALSLTVGVLIDTFTKKHATGNGAVSSDSQACSDIGVNILLKGGTAVDSAISAMVCLAVVKPASTGLMSGGYMLLHTPSGKDVTIDFQFTAPSSATETMFKNKEKKALKGGLSVAVPGLLKGLSLAHKKYGKLSWSTLIQPTVELCKDGFKIDQYTVDKIKESQGNFTKEMKKLLMPNGKVPEVGDTVKIGNLSGVLEEIAEKGSDAFYSGKIAESIVNLVKADGGNLTKSDLKNYQPIETGTYSTEFNGYKLISTQLPSSGALVLAAVNLINQLKVAKEDRHSSLYYHYLIEVFKFVSAEGTKLGDPNFDKNMTEIVKQMLSVDMAAELAKKISKNKTHPASYYGPFFSSAQTKGTANVVVLGTNGDLVSVVSTIGSPFGSMLMTSSGIILNNGMSAFSSPASSTNNGLPKSEANYIKAGKRPLSAAVPVITFNKKKPCSNQFVIGSSGGTKAITATIQLLMDLLKFGLTGSSSVAEARIHSQLQPDVVYAEGDRFKQKGLSSIIEDLKSMGHKVESNSDKLGSVNIISQQNKEITPVTDSRGNGGIEQL